jgi:hypothetical protein
MPPRQLPSDLDGHSKVRQYTADICEAACKYNLTGETGGEDEDPTCRDVCVYTGFGEVEDAHLFPHSNSLTWHLQLYAMIIGLRPWTEREAAIWKQTASNLIPLHCGIKFFYEWEKGSAFVFPTREVLVRFKHKIENMWQTYKQKKDSDIKEMKMKDIMELIHWRDTSDKEDFPDERFIQLQGEDGEESVDVARFRLFFVLADKSDLTKDAKEGKKSTVVCAEFEEDYQKLHCIHSRALLVNTVFRMEGCLADVEMKRHKLLFNKKYPTSNPVVGKVVDNVFGPREDLVPTVQTTSIRSTDTYSTTRTQYHQHTCYCHCSLTKWRIFSGIRRPKSTRGPQTSRTCSSINRKCLCFNLSQLFRRNWKFVLLVITNSIVFPSQDQHPGIKLGSSQQQPIDKRVKYSIILLHHCVTDIYLRNRGSTGEDERGKTTERQR